ncbi:MBL fold metallo-hydrolase [candidate division KSB1 bacterium]
MTPVKKKPSDFELVVRGTRGSYPVSGKDYVKYGGSTTCFEIHAGNCLIIIDAGTGIIDSGNDLMKSKKPIEAILLFTHTHIDHIQGLPFFLPIFLGDTVLYVYGPDIYGHKFEDALNVVLNPPLFPITVDDMQALKLFRTITPAESIFWSGELGIPVVINNMRETDRRDELRKKYPVEITCMKSYAHPIAGVHVYKITYKDKSIVIATDTEGYVDHDTRLINFAKGADLLLHDAGYTSEVYSSSRNCKQGYGHSTLNMAVGVAKKAKVKQLALIHHEPANDDSIVAEEEKKARKLFPAVCSAYQGQLFRL